METSYQATYKATQKLKKNGKTLSGLAIQFFAESVYVGGVRSYLDTDGLAHAH